MDKHYVPYISPQENGYKTDVRWLALRDTAGRGVMIIGQPTVCFSALHYTIEELTQAQRGTKHTVDLQNVPYVDLNVDYGQTGVGGDNFWGARALDKYTLFPQKYSYSFYLLSVERGADLNKIYLEFSNAE